MSIYKVLFGLRKTLLFTSILLLILSITVWKTYDAKALIKPSFTYKNDLIGYSFDYPFDWSIFNKGGDVVLSSFDFSDEAITSNILTNQVRSSFWQADIGNLELKQWLNVTDNSPGQVAVPTVLSTSELVIGGRQALQRITKDYTGQEYISYYIPLSSGKVFVINTIYSSFSQSLEDEFNSVLSGIKFIK